MKPCPEGFTPGYYWYGGRRRGPGHSPRWVEAVLAGEGTPRQNTPPRLQNLTLMILSYPLFLMMRRLILKLQSEINRFLIQQKSERIKREKILSVIQKVQRTSDSDSNRVDVDEHIQECEDEIQPSRYSLWTSRRPPERYRI